MMKFTFLLTAMVLTFCLTSRSFAQKEVSQEKKVTLKIRGEALPGNQPLYFIDGVKQDKNYDALATLDPSRIKSISILKSVERIAEYGNEATNGVILVTTKSVLEKDSTNSQSGLPVKENDSGFIVKPAGKGEKITLKNIITESVSSSANKALYVIDGKIVENPENFTIPNNDIESISILKATDGTKLYGDAGKNGVIIISTKKQ